MVVQELGKGAAKTLASMIPIAGNIVRAGISVTFTETLGWVIAARFAESREQGLDTDELLKVSSDAVKSLKKMGKKRR